MINTSIISDLERVLEKSAGAPELGLPQSDIVFVRRENLKTVLDEVRILDTEIREFLRDQDVNVENVHEWYYEKIKNRMEREGVI